MGSYVHGLFDHSEALSYFLQWAGLVNVENVDYRARRECDLQRLARSVEESMDINKLLTLSREFNGE
jgi:adenosylcobyric acid synthase